MVLYNVKVVRSLGVSIFKPEQIEMILDNSTRPIDVYQIMFDATNHNNTLLEWAKAHGIQMQARAMMFGGQQESGPISKAAAAHNATAKQANHMLYPESHIEC